MRPKRRAVKARSGSGRALQAGFDCSKKTLDKIDKRIEKEKSKPEINFISQADPFVNNFDCRMRGYDFHKEYIIVNAQKTRYCLGIYRTFL